MRKIIFSGMLVLVCCLFGGVEVVDGRTDISGQCIEISFSDPISPSDVCQAAGYGPCLEASGDFFMAQNNYCSSTDGWWNGGIGVVGNCGSNSFNPPPGFTCKSAMITNLVCDMRTWGMIPQPSNVPGDFNQSIKNTTDWILGFVGMIAVLMLIWGGINYLTSAGDEDKARMGKKTISYAIIGLVVAGIAYAIVDVIITVIL